MRINQYTTVKTENGVKLRKERGFNFNTAETSLMSPHAISDMLNDTIGLSSMAEEYVYLLVFTGKTFKGMFNISHGSIDRSICSVRDIMVKTLLCNGNGIVIVHNHTSGYADPSNEDKRLYDVLGKVCELMEIRLLDSIIVGDFNRYSFMMGDYF